MNVTSQANSPIDQHANECSICLETDSNTETGLLTDICPKAENGRGGHWFHPQCLKTWLDRGMEVVCPVCKTDLTKIITESDNEEVRAIYTAPQEASANDGSVGLFDTVETSDNIVYEVLGRSIDPDYVMALPGRRTLLVEDSAEQRTAFIVDPEGGGVIVSANRYAEEVSVDTVGEDGEQFDQFLSVDNIELNFEECTVRLEVAVADFGEGFRQATLEAVSVEINGDDGESVTNFEFGDRGIAMNAGG